MIPDSLEGYTAERFYKERDARTSLVVDEIRAEYVLQIRLDDSVAESVAGQLCFLTLANLASRWCRCITFTGRRMAVRPELSCLGGGDIVEVACNIAKCADPFGSFGDARLVPDDAISVTTLPSESSAFGNGWRFATGTEVESLGSSSLNPLGPVAAACVGLARAMQRCYGRLSISNAALSLWNGSSAAMDEPELTAYDIGRVLMVGAGAVGGAIAFLLPLMPWIFKRVVILDGDRIEVSNLNRVPLFFSADVGTCKADVLASYMIRSGIPAVPELHYYDESVPNLSAFDLVIPVADERGVRWSIQSGLPPLMVYGATGPDWDAHAGRHIPLRDDCFACRFPSDTPKTACAKGSVAATASAAESEPQGVLPFLSMLAGVLAVSELAKLTLSEPSMTNHQALYLLGDDPAMKAYGRVRHPNCPKCPDLFADIWRVQHQSSTFSALSAGKPND